MEKSAWEMSQPTCATLTKYYRLGDFGGKNFFLIGLEAGKSEIKMMPTWLGSDESPLLDSKWLTSGMAEKGGASSLASCCKGVNLIHEGSTLMIQSPPKGPTSKYHCIETRVSTYESWVFTNIQFIIGRFSGASQEDNETHLETNLLKLKHTCLLLHAL